MEYIVVKGEYLEQLVTRVNNLLDFGFKPIGGVSRGDNGIFYQSMFKEINAYL